ncbi:MAG TPA: flagellar motor switch protein FliN [Candidatus Hydrogenedentes bacterium]|nr:flagellar motor switch protein FliN [Candidatus Hydrogenedentota bacterium]
MQPALARVAADHLLKGAFDVLDALLAKSFRFEVTGIETADAGMVAEWLAEYAVCLSARIENDGGDVALLLRAADAARVAALVQGGAPSEKDFLTDEDRGVLKEVAESALGGAVTCLFEAAGGDTGQLAETRVEERLPEDAATLLSRLGESITAAAFSFTAEDMAGSGVLLYSESFEEIVPPRLVGGGAGAPPTPEPTLSPEEMSDILSGFGHEPPPSSDRPASAPITPPNLDMVMDIRLVATARLGRVEMPIGDILGLGPGSIVEVGHLIDEPVELLINDRLIARGDVVVVDEKFGLRITEIVSPQERIKSLR